MARLTLIAVTLSGTSLATPIPLNSAFCPMSLHTPVIFLIFNRPNVTKQVFDKIAQARPKTLFIVSDGPRTNHKEDQALVQASRAIVDRIDWPCDVHRDYATENLGCKYRVSSGITNAFDQVDRAILIEDDCLPNLSFFTFCQDLLERYQHDDRITVISGNNFQFGRSRTPYSYYFSKYPHCWGWATWRRAWQKLDLEMKRWPEFRDSGGVKAVADSNTEEDYWTKVFEGQFSGQINSWGYPWLLTCWSQSGLTILPDVNLVSNVGFGSGATHTTATESRLANLRTFELYDIQHPPLVVRNQIADQFTYSHVFRDPRPRIVRWASKIGKTLQRMENATSRVFRRSA